MSDIALLPAVVAANWDWQARGACRGMNSNTFFNPDNERGRAKRTREASAKAVCARCPVAINCLDWALTVREPFGVWGGMTATEREELLAERKSFALA
ncbi:MAG: WhiB family transcriptional regulator [Actinomycetota bacterium]|nr:WhiB family transcriptional regulator [Actinomycetota bacterium]